MTILRGEHNGAQMRWVLILFGFSFWQAWQMVVLMTPTVAALPFQNSEATYANTLWIYAAVAFGIPCSIGIKKKSKAGKKVESICAGFLAFTGTVMIVLSGMVGQDIQFRVFLAGAVACGIGCGLLLLEWAELWSILARRDAIKSVCMSYLGAFPVFFFLTKMNKTAFLITIAILLFVSIYALNLGQGEEKRLRPVQPMAVANAALSKRAIIAIAAISVVFGVAQSCYRSIVPGVGDADVIIAGVLLAVVTGKLILFSSENEPKILYQVLLPCIALGLCLLVIGDTWYAVCGFGLVLFGIYCLDILIVIVGTDLAFRLRKPVPQVFGTAFFVSRLCSLFSRIASTLLVSSGAIGASSIPAVSSLSLLVLVVVGFTVLTQDGLMDLYRLPRREPQMQRSLDSACSRVVKEYGLTTRECEVFSYLAQGRSIPYLCEQLCISQNTGKRHVSNIYRKLCIYNRQSLLDIVDQYRD